MIDKNQIESTIIQYRRTAKPRRWLTVYTIAANLSIVACDPEEQTESPGTTVKAEEHAGKPNGPCSEIVDPATCNLAVDNDGVLQCRWVTVATAQRTTAGCTYSNKHGICVSATDHEENGCTLHPYPFEPCNADLQDAYRINTDGTVTLLALPCGPTILNWNQCWENPETDPPECDCRCLDDWSSP